MKGTNIELFIPGELKEDLIFCDIIRNFKIDLKISEASFSAESGWALITVSGEKDELDKLFDTLREKGINVQIR